MPLRWAIVVLALALAVIGFLLIDAYHPRAGFVWNVLNAKIRITEECPQGSGPVGRFGAGDS